MAKECKTPAEQLEYCKSINCPDCYYCVWASYMHLPPRKTKKEVKHYKPVELSKWDKLVQDNIKSRKAEPKDPNAHPLFDEIMEVFDGQEI